MTDKSPRRFRMTPVPAPGDSPGLFAERQAQWFLELAFLRDLVHRNPLGKGKGTELADAVVLHDDSALLVHVKHQESARPGKQWAEKAIADALKQLRHSRRMLTEGHVAGLRSETLGEITFDPARYRHIYGLIVLDHSTAPFDAEGLVPALKDQGFPVHVFSLEDFRLVTERFDTAGDLIVYLDARYDLRGVVTRQVHNEAATIAGISAHIGALLTAWRPDMSSAVLERSVRAFAAKASGDLRRSADYHYGELFDDLLSRVHDQDPDLSFTDVSSPAELVRLIEQLGWYTRDRRIRLGQRMMQSCANARDGKGYFWCTLRRPTETVFTFYASSESREERTATMKAYALAAQAKYDARVSIGIATEPIGPGRSYDMFYAEGKLTPEARAKLVALGDPFGDDSQQLVI